MTTPASPYLAGIEASAQLHRALDEITRHSNGWATPALIAERAQLADVTVLLRDAIAASSSRAERFTELPAELAAAGQLRAPARLLAAMEHHSQRPRSEAESAVRTTDLANRRIVFVAPEHVVGLSRTAHDLGLRLGSLSQALESLPLGGQRRKVVELAVADTVCIVALPLAIDPAHAARAALGVVLRLRVPHPHQQSRKPEAQT